MTATVTLTIPGAFKDQSWELTVRKYLHDGSDELGQLLLFKVSSRTPELTGALLSDEFYTAELNPSKDELAFVGVGEENQLDTWGRFYALYMEGGSDGFGTAQMGLGLGSNTNTKNQEMFGKIFTDDIPDIETWGYKWLNDAMFALATGRGVVP